MSFLFGKKSKQQGNNALPQATRDITSSNGPPGPQVAALNGPPREKDGPRSGPQPQPQPQSQSQSQSSASTPSGSVNNSLSSLQGRDGQPFVPEPKALRDRAGSNEQVRRALATPIPWPCTDT